MGRGLVARAANHVSMPSPTMSASVVLTVGSLHSAAWTETGHVPCGDEAAHTSRGFPEFGGKGGNQAVAAARAGAHSRMLGALADDHLGKLLRGALVAAGVDERFVTTLPARPVPGADPDIAVGSVSDAALWQDVGLLILQNELPQAVNIAAAEQARARGIRTLFHAAPARALPTELVRLVDILVVNAVTAEAMVGEKVCCLHCAANAAMRLADRFEAVIVTAGSLGLAAYTPDDQSATLPAETVRVLSHPGAGDTFVGAFGAAVLGGAAFLDAARLGAAAAANHIHTPGAPRAR